MEFSQKIKDKLKDLPGKSGVYLFKNEAGHIIYIGKANILKNRVRSYFNATAKENKVLAMLESVFDFEYFITLSEKDALSLEANLIKKHKPRYNILLKDDKHAPYIRIDLKEKFPVLTIVRKVKNDGAKYFGPYFFGVRVGDILDILKSSYQIRTLSCSRKNSKVKNYVTSDKWLSIPPSPKQRACLNYDIGLCLAPCIGAVNEADYKKRIGEAIAFLSGKDNKPQEIILKKMEAAVENEEFERAIKYREQLKMLKTLSDRILTELENEGKDFDAIFVALEGLYVSSSVVIVRGGKLMGVKNFNSKGVLSPLDALGQFIGQYYSGVGGDIPSKILLSEQFDFTALQEYLTSLAGKKIELSVPQKGIKKKLVAMAQENAKDALVKGIEISERDMQMHEGANDRLAELLGIKSLRRIECYDISHISGTDKVASGVCFINGRMAKSEYRRYRIKTVQGIDDFASLAEVLSRRLAPTVNGELRIENGEFMLDKDSNENLPQPNKDNNSQFSILNSQLNMPDLIVIDGGKGQLNASSQILNSYNLRIPIISLAKREEEIFTLNSSDPIILPKDSFILKLLQRIRDEAHRFAVSYHRTLRSKQNSSLLEKIKGVGTKKRTILLKTFDYSIEKIKLATLTDLEKTEGIDKKTAQAVIDFFATQN